MVTDERTKSQLLFANSWLIRDMPLDNYGRPQSREKVLKEKKERYGIEVIPITKEELDRVLVNDLNNNIPSDTPMGLEDDNPISDVGF